MKILLFLILLMSFPVLALGATVPPFPMAFWGKVSINGSPVPVGGVIRAYYGNTLVGEAIVREGGIYGYAGSTQQKLVVGEGEGNITFKIQSSAINNGNETAGTSAQVHASFESGVTVNKDFNFQTGSAANSGSNSSSGGSSGGGGGNPPPVTTQLSVAAQKVDANKDNKIDVLDFNTLMVHWGKTEVANVADFTSDGKVDIFDFNALMIQWTVTV